MSEDMGGDANNELVWATFNALADSGLAAGGDPAACVAIVGALIHTRQSMLFAKAADQIEDDPTFTRAKSLVSHDSFFDGGHLPG